MGSPAQPGNLRGLLILAISLAAIASLLLVGGQAEAIPAFARKYETSCATCHTVFPRLTAFGSAFRMAGHRFPDGVDEDMVKDEGMALGVDAYKRVFPASIWPASMSLRSPLSVVVKSNMNVWEKGDGNPLDFKDLEPVFDLYLSASMGERISLFGKLQVNGPECNNCHTYFFGTVNDVIPNSTIKIGKFQPEFFSFHQQPFVEFHDILGPAHSVGSNTWTLGKNYGIELSGTIVGRLRYVVGVLEGSGNLDSLEKDVYARVAYKIGGARLDGVAKEGYEAPTKNWRERSLVFGGTFYKGWGKLSSNDELGAPLTLTDSFWVGALDGSLLIDDLNLFGGGVWELHSAPTGTDSNVLVERYYAGVRYTHWPWLVPEILFDYFNSELRGDFTYQFRARVEVLARANLKLRVEAALTRPVGERPSFRSIGIFLDAGF